ncbi:MAG: 1-acyl-sn-glycerol-3-phosphate acyltransferase [Thermosynechococcaceae cyanobacterium]
MLVAFLCNHHSNCFLFAMLASGHLPIPWDLPLIISQRLLEAFGTYVSGHFLERIPSHETLLIVSNHRSFLDAPVLMSGLGRTVNFACHPYMGQVPLMRNVIQGLGGFPLETSGKGSRSLLQQADALLRCQRWVGIFPEGGEPMVKSTQPEQIGEFQRGFAHLALRSQIPNLTILPVAIASHSETEAQTIPLQVLSWFDPSEPLFRQSGQHPAVFYKNVDLLVGNPIKITAQQQERYQGKSAKATAIELTQRCHAEIADLLKQSLG